VKDHGVKRYQHLDEVNNADAVVVNETTGFRVLEVNESAIFYSFDDEGKYKFS
jgi:hypothetical protein